MRSNVFSKLKLSEILLAVLCLVLLVAVIALAIVLGVSNGTQTNNHCDDGGGGVVPVKTDPLDLTHYAGQFLNLDMAWDDQYYQDPKPKRDVIMIQLNKTLGNFEKMKLSIFSLKPAQNLSGDDKTRYVFVQFRLGFPKNKAPAEHSLIEKIQKSVHNWLQVDIVNDDYPQGTDAVGQSEGWKKAAKMFEDSIDLSVDPCDDFYQFACGKWMANPDHQPTEHMPRYGNFYLLQNTALKDVASYFGNTTDGPSTPRPLNLSRIVYDSCMRGVKTETAFEWVKLMVKDFGGWPISTSNWTAPMGNFSDARILMAHLAGKYDVNTLLRVGVTGNYAHPENGYILEVDQAQLTFPDVFYRNTTNSTNAKLNSSMWTAVNMFREEGVSDEQIQTEVTELIDFEMELVRISASDTLRRNYSRAYNVKTLDEADRRWPSMNFTQIMFRILDEALGENSTETKPDLGHVMVAELDYMDALNTMLSNSSLSHRKLQNYLIWRFVHNFMPFMNETSDMHAKMHLEIQGTPVLQNEMLCANYLLDLMPDVASRIYIERHFNGLPSDTTKDINTMIDSVVAAFREMLNKLVWMDADSRKYAMQKTQDLDKLVAFAKWVMNDTQFTQRFETLAVTENADFYVVYNQLMAYNTLNATALLNQRPFDRKRFYGSSATVNAWYDPQSNSITFPAAILNAPFFDADYPWAVNYGGMGLVMGHELTHGFDDGGVQWNAAGVLDSWLDAQSTDGFGKMAQCVIDQYSQFCPFNESTIDTYPVTCTIGVQTQGENIADNGGIRASYNAYRHQIGHELRLPSPMDRFNMEQIYFLAFGQVWCENTTPEEIERRLLVDVHSAGRYRVNGAVSNFPEFARAFNCPRGSKMAPYNHCNVWT